MVRSIMMRRVVLAATILLTVPLAGCVLSDDGTGPGEDPIQVQWTQEPQNRDTDQAIDIAWRLSGPQGEIQHTGLHWANHSVPDPQSPADYGNSSGIQEPAQVPGNYSTTVTIEDPGTYHFRAHIIADNAHQWTPEATIEVTEPSPTDAPLVVTLEDHSTQGTVNQPLTANWSLTGTPDEVQHTGFHWADHPVSEPESPADYGNSSGIQEPAQVPGNYSATFTEDEAGTYYGRAHAIYDGQQYFSEEVSFEVQSADHYVVDMVGFRFDPADITVQPGDTINWTNSDQVSHTATKQGGPGPTSGDISPGSYYNWTVPADTPAGTYDYVCTYHEGGGMTGTITVQEAS